MMRNDYQETQYTRSELLAESKAAFGIRPEIMAGALALEPDRESFGRNEAKDLIIRFKKREVEK